MQSESDNTAEPQTEIQEQSGDVPDEGVFAFGDEYEAAHLSLACDPPDSGDFHAAFPLEDGSVALVIGDVVGHGLEAARHANRLCRAVAGCLEEGLSPEEALGFVNAAAEMSQDFSGFATVFAGTVAPNTGVIHYASGGHPSALIANAFDDGIAANKGSLGDAVQELTVTGPPLGVLGADEVRYRGGDATLPEGATLLLYTDGITEARRGRHLFGVLRLRRIFARFAALSPLTLVRRIFARVRDFVGSPAVRRDDIVLFALRRRSPGG